MSYYSPTRLRIFVYTYSTYTMVPMLIGMRTHFLAVELRKEVNTGTTRMRSPRLILHTFLSPTNVGIFFFFFGEVLRFSEHRMIFKRSRSRLLSKQNFILLKSNLT